MNVNNTPETSGRMPTSLSRKLTSMMFFRLLGVFISLDILICLIAGAALVCSSENRAAAATTILVESGMPDESAAAWTKLTGVEIARVTDVPQGFRVPAPFAQALPPETRDAQRTVISESALNATFFEWLDGLSYVVYPVLGLEIYQVAVALGLFLRVFCTAMIVLVAFEFLSLILRSRKDKRIIRRTLEPITELTRAAQSLNDVSKQFDPEKMAALAGKLEGINASRLDTRIQIDETQVELKNLAQAINSMLDRINEAYSAQVRFVSDASHELRTPISVIQGYANLLDRWGKHDEKTLQESINAIKEEASSMKDLIEQLLFLARGDNNTIMLQTETFNLAELAGEVYNETKMIDASHNFIANLTDVYVTADKALMKQAARILVDNAVKYTDPGGTITLSTSAENGNVKLSVSDNGVGISPEIVPRVFDRFYRAEESRARATGGAGLGLSIAKWITSRHGGFIDVLSRENIGTRISLVLPSSKLEAVPVDAEPERI